MTDHDFKAAVKSASSSNPKSAADMAISAALDLKNKASVVAATSADTIKEKTGDVLASAQDAASDATDKIRQTIDEQKKASAEYVGGLAKTLRRAAGEFDGNLPVAGRYIRKAATQVESVSEAIKTGDFDGWVREAKSFARQQPTAFLGIAALAGFGVVRFLKSSSNDTDQTRMGSISQTSPSQSDAKVKGYRDEFSK